MGASIRLGRIWGIPIGINYTWVVGFLLFIFLMSRQFADVFPGPERWLIAIITTVLFFLSVLAHELSHSLVALRRGIPVRGITLFIFGGVSQLGHEARHPGTEFIVAIVGPLTSIVLGFVMLALWNVTKDVSDFLSSIFFSLFAINISLGVFNMLPGFPLDGGRVLRSVVWGATGSYWRATQIAARAGQGIGGVIVVIGLGWAIGSGPEFLWLSLIGGFLVVTATLSYRQESVRESLRAYKVADIMTTDWYTLPGETPLTSPLVAQGFSGGDDFVGVLINGQMQGIVTRRQMAQATRGAWSYTTLAQIMRPLSALVRVEPSEAIFDVVERMDADNLERVAVTANDMLLGFMTRANGHRFVSARRPSRFRA